MRGVFFMKNANIKVLCQTAILIAVYVLLSMTLVIRTGNWKLTFVALPVIIASLSLGTGSGCAVALIGEFLSQMLTFGLMHTTIIWIWPLWAGHWRWVLLPSVKSAAENIWKTGLSGVTLRALQVL